MNLEKLSNEQKLVICRRYFIGGFFLLPFLWLVNAAWFYSWAFHKRRFAEQPLIRRYVLYSAAGSLLWLVALIAWQIVYQTCRTSWGAAGDNISFFLPLGRL